MSTKPSQPRCGGGAEANSRVLHGNASLNAAKAFAYGGAEFYSTIER